MPPARVVHLSRPLTCKPAVCSLSGVALRTFSGDDDIDKWLDLRDRCFAAQHPPVRRWTQADFASAFLDKRWWSPNCLWFAQADEVVGSVTLAFRGDGLHAVPVVHWLMVLPEWRRRGIGRLLMSAVELSAWRAGHRTLALESHSGWTAANSFYRAIGYI